MPDQIATKMKNLSNVIADAIKDSGLDPESVMKVVAVIAAVICKTDMDILSFVDIMLSTKLGDFNKETKNGEGTG